MFCGNAAGEFIPPMAVYNSEHCYENWTTGGYNSMVYGCATNGWFDSRTFQAWFFKQFILSIRKHQGKQDNLSKDAFPSMLRKLMQRLKPSNLIAGFKATGISPLNSNEILKRLPDETVDNSFNESVFIDFVLKALRENCEVGLKPKRKQSKRGEKLRKTD